MLANFAIRLIAAGLETLGKGYGEGTATYAPIVGIAAAVVAFNLARQKYGHKKSPPVE